MPIAALGLLVAAAAIHTLWNLLVKRAREKQIFTWWSLVIGSGCCLPILAFSAPLPAQIWPYVVSSALAEGVYFVLLTQAYSQSDFSLVYPLARGAAPALLALWAFLFLGESPRPGGLAGLALLLLGLLVVAWGARQRQVGSTTSSAGILMALGVAGCISIYSIIDAAAVRIASPAPYIVVVISLTALLVAPVMFVRYGRGAILAECRSNWMGIASVGVMTILAYVLVLLAYQMTRASYAGAVREVSVVFAALVGWRWLGEPFGALRTAGAGLIFVGIFVIAALG